MHTAALKAAGLQGEYKEYPVPAEGLWAWLSRVSEMGLDGFNVTMPYKRSVFSWVVGEWKGTLGRLEEMSGAIGALNTVVLRDGYPHGYNTDGEGFLQTLTQPPRSLKMDGWHAVLLGSGGAAQAIAVTLALRTRVKRLTVWNRHPEGAAKLKALLDSLREQSRTRMEVDLREELAALPVAECQMVANTTSAGMKGQPELPLDYARLRQGQVVYDIVYEPRETRLIQEGRKRGCTVVTGDEMLAGQGAAAFEIWTGVKGMLPVMRKALDEKLGAR